MLDTLIHQAAQRGMGNQAGRFVGLLADSLVNTRTGGFAGLTKRFEDAGLGDLLQSWIGAHPADHVLHPDQFSAGFGQQESNRIAQLLGVTPGAVNMAGAETLPRLVALITTDGRYPIPGTLPAPLAVLIGENETPQQTRREGLGWVFWLILALLIALFIMAISQCRPALLAQQTPPHQPRSGNAECTCAGGGGNGRPGACAAGTGARSIPVGESGRPHHRSWPPGE